MDVFSPSTPAEARKDPGKRARCSAAAWIFILLAAAILFAASRGTANRIVESPKLTASRIRGKNISDAIDQFYEKYNRLPVPSGKKSNPQESIDTDSSPDSGLIRILLGREPDGTAKQNTGNINFLADLNSADSIEGPHATQWLEGILADDPNPSLIDAWGNFYRIRLDSRYSGQLPNPDSDEPDGGRSVIFKRCIVWSAGTDGEEDTWSDNPKSWD